MHFRRGLIDEHFIWIGMARLTITIRLSNTAMKFVNHGNINDEVRYPSNLQPLDLQVPTFLAAASWNTLAAVGNVTSGICNVSKC